MIIDAFTLLRKISGQENIETTPKIYIKLLECRNRAFVLNQIIFWSDKSTDLKEGWFHKDYSEWFEETSIPERSMRRILTDLQKRGYIEKTSRKIRGNKKLILRPVIEKIMEDLSCIINDPSGQNGRRAIRPNCPFTEDDTYIYTEEYTKDAQSPPSEDNLSVSKEVNELINVWNEVATKVGCPAMGKNKRELNAIKRHVKEIKEKWDKVLCKESFSAFLNLGIKSEHYMLTKYKHPMHIVLRWHNFESIYKQILDY